jgi:hypothetical protein
VNSLATFPADRLCGPGAAAAGGVGLVVPPLGPLLVSGAGRNQARAPTRPRLSHCYDFPMLCGLAY